MLSKKQVDIYSDLLKVETSRIPKRSRAKSIQGVDFMVQKTSISHCPIPPDLTQGRYIGGFTGGELMLIGNWLA